MKVWWFKDNKNNNRLYCSLLNYKGRRGREEEEGWKGRGRRRGGGGEGKERNQTYFRAQLIKKVSLLLSELSKKEAHLHLPEV